jgi:hypothetical protein
MNKIKPIYIVAGVIVLGLAAWSLTDSPAPVKRERKVSERPASRQAKVDTFTEEDYKAKFGRLAEAPKNVFKPLVLGSASGSRLAPNEIPSAFTGGTGRWSYTGTAVIDGAPQALVENSETGEGEFIRVGQQWKSSTVKQITPTLLVLEGPNGSVRALELMKDPVDEMGNFISPTVRPVSPVVAQNLPESDQNRGRDRRASMSGPIGASGSGAAGSAGASPAVRGGEAVVSSAPPAPNLQPDPTFIDLGGFIPDDTVIDLSSTEQQ